MNVRKRSFVFNPQRVGVDRAVLFSRQMVCGVGGQPVERAGEMERRGGSAQPVALHQVFGQQEIAHGGDDRHEQDGNGGFPLKKELFHERESAAEVTRGEGVPQFKDDPGARSGNHQADIGHGNFPARRT